MLLTYTTDALRIYVYSPKIRRMCLKIGRRVVFVTVK